MSSDQRRALLGAGCLLALVAARWVFDRSAVRCAPAQVHRAPGAWHGAEALRAASRAMRGLHGTAPPRAAAAQKNMHSGRE